MPPHRPHTIGLRQQRRGSDAITRPGNNPSTTAALELCSASWSRPANHQDEDPASGPCSAPAPPCTLRAARPGPRTAAWLICSPSPRTASVPGAGDPNDACTRRAATGGRPLERDATPAKTDDRAPAHPAPACQPTVHTPHAQTATTAPRSGSPAGSWHTRPRPRHRHADSAQGTARPPTRRRWPGALGRAAEAR